MIVDLLVEHRWLVPVALAIVLVVGAVIGRWLADRPRLAWWLTAASALPVLALTMLPEDRRPDAVCVVQWSLPRPGRVELIANVALFVAPVLLGAIASRRPLRAFVVGAMLSLAIEGTQALVPALGRSCDTNDWASNTIGAAVGASVACAVLRMTRVDVSRRASALTSTPSSPAPPGSGRATWTAGWRRES